MQFNPDPNKQANEVIFSRKPSSNNLSYQAIKFNNNDRSKTLRNCFRFILNFNAHVGQKIKNETE